MMSAGVVGNGSQEHLEALWKAATEGPNPNEGVLKLIADGGVYSAPSPYQEKLGAVEFAFRVRAVTDKTLRALLAARARPVQFPTHHEYHALNRALIDDRSAQIITLLLKAGATPTDPGMDGERYVSGTLDFAAKHYTGSIEPLVQAGAKGSLTTVDALHADDGLFMERESRLFIERPSRLERAPPVLPPVQNPAPRPPEVNLLAQPAAVAPPAHVAQAPVAAPQQPHPPASAAPQPRRSFFGCLCAPFAWFFGGIGSIFSWICGGIAALFANPERASENE